MRRAFLFAVLSLLLLSMQQQGYVHPIAHLAGKYASHSQETVLSAPQFDVACVECAASSSRRSRASSSGMPTTPNELPDTA